MIAEVIGVLKQHVYLGNSLFKYSVVLLAFLGGLIAVTIMRRIILVKLARLAEKTTSLYDDVIVDSTKKYLIPLSHFLLFYICFTQLKLNPKLYGFCKAAILLVTVFFCIRFFLSFVRFWLYNFWAGKGENVSARKNLSSAIMTILKVVLWLIGLLLFLDNIGVKVSAFIAGLGVGGIAIAFAAQAVLQDVFSYFSIFFDNPFQLGDLISVGDIQGTVEHIGIKTTRIRSVTGEQIVISNSALIGSKLHNFKRMNERRAVMNLDVTYSTEFEKLKEIPSIIKNIVEETKGTRFGRCHFVQFADSSLKFEAAYYVLSNDYALFRDIQQNVNLNVKKIFDEKGIEFAFPSQSVYIEK
ncbi:MAG: mechanosensitive ion channel family protein [Leptospirales bacterium]|nr:mechanosensitive ion channel family protein [Leptospirales bacterium]